MIKKKKVHTWTATNPGRNSGNPLVGTKNNVRFIDFVYHSTLGLRVIKKEKTTSTLRGDSPDAVVFVFFFFITLEPRVE